MSDKNKIAIELVVDDKGTGRIKQFAGDADTSFRKVEAAGIGAASRIEKGWSKLKSAWVVVLAGILAVREGWELMNSAAKARQEEASFASLAASYGANGKQIIASLREVSRGTVDTLTLIRSAGTAMMMGIRPEETIGLMKIAQATAKMTGQTTVKAFGDITLAVGRQSKMILDNLGIIVSVEKANAAYALKLGKTASSLTDAEKKQAFFNATMAAGNDLMERLGPQTDTAADKLQRMTATFENIKVTVGSGLLRTFSFLEGTFLAVAAASLAVSGGIFKIIQGATSLTDRLHMTAGAAAEWKLNAQAAFGAADELARKSDQSFKDMKSSNEGVLESQRKITSALEETTKAQAELEKGRKDILATAKKEAEEMAAAQEEMYKETGALAEAHYAAEAQKLVEKAARWQKSGADIVTTENWLYDAIGKLEVEAAAKGETAASGAMDRMQSGYRTLVDELTAVTKFGMDEMEALGIKVQGLDGTGFTIHAALDGSGFESEIDTLVAKFQELAGAASAARSAASGSGSSSSSSSSSSSGSTDWDGGSYDSYQVAADSQTGRDGMVGQERSGGDKTVTSTTVININQAVSRSDVTALISEQKRQEARI